MIKLSCLLIAVFSATLVLAQNTETYPNIFEEGQKKALIVYKTRKHRNLRYMPGNHIEIKTNNRWHSGNLEWVSDTLLLINGEWVATDEIRKVRKVHNFLYGGGLTMIVGGVLYLPLVVLNRGLNNAAPLLPKSDLITSASVIGGGYILSRWHATRVKIKSRDQLKIIDFGFEKNK